MSEELSIINKYIKCFDDCKTITYKGVTISPFLAKDIRECNQSCYCLLLEPVELNDISLMPLKRLDLILTIFRRLATGYVIESQEVLEKYHIATQSFRLLLDNVFKGYRFDISDPSNAARKNVLCIIDDKAQKYQVFNATEFEEICDLILYHNGIDISYKEKYPYEMRKDMDRYLNLMNKGTEAPSTEKMIDSAFLFIKDYEKVLNMPLRKFYNLILNIQKREEYEIVMSGAYIEKNISYWMSGGYEQDPYKNMVTTEDKVINQFNDL